MLILLLQWLYQRLTDRCSVFNLCHTERIQGLCLEPVCSACTELCNTGNSNEKTNRRKHRCTMYLRLVLHLVLGNIAKDKREKNSSSMAHSMKTNNWQSETMDLK